MHFSEAKKAAHAAGAVWFWTDSLCNRGHRSPRYTANGNCVECQCGRSWQSLRDEAIGRAARTEARLLRLPKYSVPFLCEAGHNSPRWTANTSCCECVRIRQRGYKRDRDPDERARAQRNYLAQPEKRDQHVCHTRQYRARKRRAVGTHTADDVDALMALQNGKCAYCRRSLKQRREVDHIVALSCGGSNDRSNLQLLCRSCNARKSDLDPIEFAQRIGMLV